MTYNEIISNLKKRIFHPVYFLTGEEPYFIDEISSFIENSILDESEREFNQIVLYGRDTDMKSVINNCKRYPMMASHFVVIVREAQDLDDLEGLEKYLEKPLESTVLVLSYKYKKVDGRTALSKKIKDKAVFFESPRIYDNKIPDWITTFLKGRNYGISPKASFMLAEYLGAQLGKIVNELEKLMINLKEGSVIDESIIEQNIGISKDFNVFELQNAFMKKDVLKANMIVKYFAANPKENPLLKVVPIVYGFFLKVLMYQQLPDKSQQNAARELGINPFFVKDYQEAARHYSFDKLVHIIAVMREYDLRGKGINNDSAEDGELMREMIYKIMH